MARLVDFEKAKRNRALKHGVKPAPFAKPLEVCTACGALTDIPVDTPVSERTCYVPGGGQLCRTCCMKLYHTDDLRTLPELYGEF